MSAIASLRDYQGGCIAEVRQAMREGVKRVMVYSPTGCHARGQGVLLANGRVVAVENVAVGDVLMGPGGALRRVRRTVSSHGPLYRVTPVKGAPYVVNDGHILSLRMTPGGDNLSLADGARVPAGADVVNVNVEVFAASNKTARHCLKGWRSDAVEFARVPEQLRLDPYWLGCWLGDGHSNGPTITKGACLMIERWKGIAVAAGHEVSEADRRANCSAWRVTNKGSTNEFTLGLRHYGLIGNKHIPEAFKFASMRDRLALLAGMIDSDGSLRSSTFDWISVRRQLAEDFAFVCRSVGLAAYIAPCRKGIKALGFVGDYWRVSVSGDTSIVPCLDKRAPPRQQKKRHLVHGITVEPAGVGDWFGFEVDGDNLYLLDDFTVTHNSGKSIVSAAIIESAAKRGRSVAWVCNRIELVHQAAEHLRRAGVSCGVLQGDNSRAEYLPVVACSIQTIARRGAPEGCDLFLVDEAHFCAASKEFHALLDRYPDVPMIGFSATPFARGLGKVGPHGPLFGRLVVAATIPDLIAQGWLVDADVYAPGEPDLSGVKTVAGDYHEQQLGEAVDKPELVGDIVTHWLKLGGGKQTLCFATNIAHSQHITRQFVECGVKAAHLDAYSPDSMRRSTIDAFKAGDVTVLSNCALLAEGFDAPAAKVMILARPTKSLTRMIQMAGRILRPHEGATKALILDHSGTIRRLGFPTDPLPLELDDGRPRKAGADKPKPEALPKLCPSCSYLKPAKVHKCPACGFAPERQSDVVVQEGELTLMRRGTGETAEKRHQVRNGIEEFGGKQSAFGQLLTIQRQHGYKDGWVANKYRTIFGVWPRGLEQIPEPVSARMSQFLRAEAIRYSYAKKKGEQRAAA